MKKGTRIFSVLLAVLMVLTVMPVIALSATEAQAVAAPTYWDGTASSATTTVTDVMAFVQAGTTYTATEADLEGHLTIDTARKEIHIVDELGFAIFVIMTNNPYTIYENDGATVKYDGERETAVDATYGITDIVANATIYLDNDLYLNDPAKDVSEWKSVAPMFMRPLPNNGGTNGTLTFDGQGHSITGWYCDIALTSADHGASFGLFGMPVVYDFFTVKNVALLAQKLNITADNTWTKTIVAGSIAAGAWVVGGSCDLTVDSVVIDSEISASIQATNSTGGAISGQMWTSTQSNAKAENKNIVVAGVVGCPQNRPSVMTETSNINGTTTLTNIAVKTDITEFSSNRAWGAAIFTNDRAKNLKLENIVALSTAHGFDQSLEEFAPTFIKRFATFTSLSYKNVFVNGALHTDMADTTYGSNFSTVATVDDLLPYNIYKQQRDNGAFEGWDIAGEIAVPAALASQAAAIDAIFNADTTAYWDGTVPGIVDGVEVDNILAEGESVLDYVLSGKEYVLSKNQFAAHLTHGITTSATATGNLTVLDEIGFAMYVLMSNNSFKVMDGETVWYNGARSTANNVKDGFDKLFGWGSSVLLARDLYLNDSDLPMEERNSLAPIGMRVSANVGASQQVFRHFNGQNHTIYGWYVEHEFTAADNGGLLAYGFIGVLYGSYGLKTENFALVDAAMNLSMDSAFTGTVMVGALFGAAKYQTSPTTTVNNVAVDMTVNSSNINNGGYYWRGESSFALTVGGLFGATNYCKNDYDETNTKNGTLNVTDCLISLKATTDSTTAFASGFGWSLSQVTVNISNTAVYTDFDGFAQGNTAATTFGTNAAATTTLTNLWVNGAVHANFAADTAADGIILAATGVRTIGSLDLLGGVFAATRGEGFANWSTDGAVAVPASYLADAAAFGDAILTDSAIRALGMSLRTSANPEKQGLRASFEVNHDALKSAGYTLKYGALCIPAKEVNMKGATLEVDTENVLDFAEYGILILDADDTGANSERWVYANAGQFNCAIVNLPAFTASSGTPMDALNIEFSMRGYVSVLDGDGAVVATVYTATMTTSTINLARIAVELGSVSGIALENLQALIARAEQAA